MRKIFWFLLIVLVFNHQFLPAQEGGKKLRVFILAGQSNMVGHARTATFDYIADDPRTADILSEMIDGRGRARTVLNTWIASCGDPDGERFGPLTAGYGARSDPAQPGDKIGPEFTFGIYMQKALKEPILIIKTAWGGKSLFKDFRPPSAGPYDLNPGQIKKIRQRGGDVEAEQRKAREESGAYYRLMIHYIHRVLADIQRVCPAYDKTQGYDISGFVWFQGWNDMVNSDVYPDRGTAGGYDLYTHLLTAFIHDVRNDLGTPELPFVIGVMGVNGPLDNVEERYRPIHAAFRGAMAAPASLPEFTGTVLAVKTAPFWETELDHIMRKRDSYTRRVRQLTASFEKGDLTADQKAAALLRIQSDTLSPAESALLKRGASNAAYHYLGCAKTVAQIGKAFAEAMRELQKPQSEHSPRIVNIINFIRRCEPRIEWITEDVLYETVVEQIAIMKRYQLPGTFLLQYDALMDERYQRLLKDLPPEMFEIGAWWEIPQPLVENSGYEWRGRYAWDWHADVGFATGYTPKERERLVDTYMADFNKIFGSYPKSAGSWFIDAHTLQYMHDRYGILASCNCKDQIGTDGYTLWGGYWNQGYYPSRKNAYMPAQHTENQIPVPIFRMLGSDPIHQYDNGLGGSVQRVVSLEPVYAQGGGDADWCNWYFREFIDGPAMAYGYVQTGQENSFTWKKMGEGFRIQMPLIERLRKEGHVTVQTLAATGDWFRKTYPVTPPTSVTVLSDHSDKDLKTVWFNSRFYRANLLWEGGTLRFRDIHLFDESVASAYLLERGTSTQCDYYTLPFVDGFRWSEGETVAGLRFMKPDGSAVQGGDPLVNDDIEGQLQVNWPLREAGGSIRIVFRERSVTITAPGIAPDSWFLELAAAHDAELPFVTVTPKAAVCLYKGAPYTVSVPGGSLLRVSKTCLRAYPLNNRLVFDMSRHP